jgi:hypothetical protein
MMTVISSNDVDDCDDASNSPTAISGQPLMYTNVNPRTQRVDTM